MSADEEDRDFVRALARGLAVIESFEGQKHPASLSEIAARAKLSRGTVRRSLITLAALGYAREELGRYTLTPRMLRLGYSYLSSEPIWTLARHYLEELHQEFGETTSMSVLDGDMIVYVLRIAAARLLHDTLSIGSRLPAYPAAMGRLLLADLPQPELDGYLKRTELRALTPHTVVDPGRLRAVIAEAGASGYAISDQEMELGLRSIAVPVIGPDGRAVAAINVGCWSARTTCAEMEANYLPPLRAVAARISELLTHHGRTTSQGQSTAP